MPLALGAPKENAGAAPVSADAAAALPLFTVASVDPPPPPNLNGAADPAEALSLAEDAPKLGLAAPPN